MPETVSGVGDFVKDGAGQLLFGGGHDASTLIKAGRLTLGSGSNLADSRSVTVNSGGIFDLDVSDLIGSISGAGEIQLASGVILGAGVDNTSTTFSGVISGLGGYSKLGTGSLSFTGANLYEGSTSIVNGSLIVGGSLSDLTNGLLRLMASMALQQMIRWVRLLVPVRFSLGLKP